MQVLGALANVLQFYTQKLLAMYVFAPSKKPYSASTTSTIAYGLMLGADFVSLLTIDKTAAVTCRVASLVTNLTATAAMLHVAELFETWCCAFAPQSRWQAARSRTASACSTTGRRAAPTRAPP